MEDEMFVTKRNGNRELMSFDKILTRIKTAGQNLKVNPTALALKVINQLFDGISSTKIDELSAEQCASMSSTHPDYNVLAGRIIISNHHKNTTESFSTVMSALYQYLDKHGQHSPLVSKELYEYVQSNSRELDDLCDYQRDYLIDYFGFKTLEKSYLFKIDGQVKERPQHMWLRVAIGIHGDNLDKIKETYFYMSNKYFTHATPTLFNAGTPKPQLSSCYLLAMENDSIDGIYNTLKDCALISKFAGGIGLHIHNVRARGSHIRGTNGSSNGIVPMLRVFNNTAKYVDQCVVPDTVIYTTDGPIQIQNCTIGQTQIFNLTGGTEVIQNVLEHYYEGDILKISTDFSRYDLEITPQHPIYIIRDGDKEPQWIEAGDVMVNDKIVYSIPNFETDIENINEEECRIYAYLINYGGVVNGKYEINLEPYIDLEFIPVNIYYIKHYLDTHFVQYEIADGDSKISWNPVLQLPFRYSDFYDTNTGEKRIHPRWLNLPIKKIQVIYSILDDYHILKSPNTKCLKRQIQYLELRIAQINLRIGLEYVNTEKTLVCTTVTSIQKGSYKGILYDLQIETEHNYLLANGLVHNGGGKRNGSFAIYLEPWHADIRAFLEMRKNHGDEELKARDLFYALWIPDLFMERIKTDGQWTLMCPDECPGLADVYGDEFKILYEGYENAGKGRETVRARDLWFQVLDAQMETGTPYLLYKDAANKKSNQKNVGTIKSSNLCVAPETLILTDRGHIEIKSLCDQTVNVWNGKEFSEVGVNKTGENQELINVYTDDGLKLACTPYHKFHIQTKYDIYSNEIQVMVEARDLRPGDKIIRCEYPKIDGTDSHTGDPNQIPSDNCSLKVKIEWFNTYFNNNLKPNGHFPENTDYDYQIRVKQMLQTCGTHSVVKTVYETDGTKSYRLIPDASPTTHTREFVKILKIEDENRVSDTYCFTEPKRHMGVFNGMITGQCTEIIEYSDDKESAVCNLASIALPTFIIKDKEEKPLYDYAKLHEVTKIVTYNLNRIIDVNYYPTEKTHRSNMRHRPIGIGVQGLADTFIQLGYHFISDEAKEVNRDIFETIYHAALEASMEIAQKERPYETFVGSPASQGILQFDLWDITPQKGRYDWAILKKDIQTYGLRNSLLLAPMPTASTSQILGFNECIEPITSNIYSRRTNAGDFVIANKYLMNDLIALDLWNEQIKNNIIANNGSVQQIDIIPQEIKDRYKTVWELPMRQLIDMAADRGAFICQSQSLNLWLEDPTYAMLTSMHFYSWSKGLKTGIYYLRRRGKHQAQQFTIEPEKTTREQKEENDICEMCSS
jgi:ribonucleotide reductase alpha subunit